MGEKMKEKERCLIKAHHTEEEKIKLSKQLNRIEGQVRGINKMLQEDRHCDDILMQISAATNSLKKVGEEILKNHMKLCMVEDIKNEKLESIDEIIYLIGRLK